MCGALGPQRTWALSSHNLFSILVGVRGKRWEGQHRETQSGNPKLTLESTNTTHQVLQPSCRVRCREALIQHPSTVPIPDMLCIWTKGERGYNQTLPSGVLGVEVLELCLLWLVFSKSASNHPTLSLWWEALRPFRKKFWLSFDWL